MVALFWVSINCKAIVRQVLTQVRLLVLSWLFLPSMSHADESPFPPAFRRQDRWRRAAYAIRNALPTMVFSSSACNKHREDRSQTDEQPGTRH